MKRNIFKLLVALFALAAFQPNAHAQSGGLGYKGDKTYFLEGFNGYGGGVLSPTLGWVHDVYPDTSLVPTGAMTLGTDGLFKYKSGAPEFGNVLDYFTLENVKDIANNDIKGQFYIRAYNKQDPSEGKLVQFGPVDTWEVVQFSPLTPTLKDPYVQDPVTDGGYLSAPSAGKADMTGRLLLVRDKNNVLDLKTYSEYIADSAASKRGFKPVYVKANPVSSRWARLSDFKSFPDFIKIKDINGSSKYLTVDGVDNFKIVRSYAVGSIVGDDGISALSPEVTVGATQDQIELFTLLAPSRGSKAVTVKRNNNVYERQGMGSNSVFGDLLSLEGITQLNTTNPFPVGTNILIENQQFAIWIEDDGSMSLYPYAAWTFVFGKPGNSQYVLNQAIKQNDHEYTGNILAETFFKIGIDKASGEYVVGPTHYATTSTFRKADFNVLDNTKYNYIPEKRYFYLESNIMGPDGKPLVLDVVRQYTSTGDIENKLVLASKDWKNPIHLPYYDKPYDSLNLSAYWQFEAVYNTDSTPSLSEEMIIGYKIMNELGDVLQFADNGASVWNPSYATKWQETDVYLDPTANGSDFVGATVRPWVWKVFNRMDQDNSSIFLKNIAGAAYVNATGDALLPKYITSPRPEWNLTIDTASSRGFNTSAGVFSPFDYLFPNTPQNCFYLSNTDPSDVDQRHTYFETAADRSATFPATWATCGALTNFSEVDGVIQRNMASYREDYHNNFQAIYLNDVFYNIYANTAGFELKIKEVFVADDSKNAPVIRHDSINKGTGEQLWDKYAVDSLFNYFYKEGTYTITEAIGMVNALKEGDQDGILYVGHPDKFHSDDIIVELLDSAIINRLTNSTLRGVTGKDSTPDVYKWYTFKSKKTGKYLTFDRVDAALKQYETQYGGVFNEDLIQNATRFRLYQPLHGDKKRDNFIIETVVPQHYYTNTIHKVNGVNKYVIDVTRGEQGYRETSIKVNANYVDQWGETYYAIIRTGSTTVGFTKDVIQATRWTPWIESIQKCKIDYIDNDFLADTRMFGAPLTAERWASQSPFYSGDFISIPTNTSLNKVVEGDEGEVVTFTLVPAALISPNGNIQNKFYSANDNVVPASYFSTTDKYNFGTETRPVQLYYIRRDVRKGAQITRTFLTVTDQTVLLKDLKPNMVPSVAGAILDFKPAFQYPVGASVNKDTLLLQMFAVYGQLGLDADRKNADGSWNTPCISPADSVFHFGVFNIIPAASNRFNYQAQNKAAVDIVRNVNIGNSSVEDEFRVSDYTSTVNGYERQLVVYPGGSQGSAASDYVFSYVPYLADFACPNFVDVYDFGQKVRNPLVCDARDSSFFWRDYADPSQQWVVNHLSTSQVTNDYYAYKFQPVAEFTRTQAPAKQKVMKDPQYLFLVEETEHTTAYGDKGYVRDLTAIKQYKRGADGKYVFPERFDDIFTPIQVTQITNKYIGDVTKVDAVTRTYNGDSTIDYFYKFNEGELTTFDWAIIESVYKDRYMWAHDFKIPVKDSLEAYIDIKDAKYLKLIASNVNTIAACDGVIIHEIPYYNIVYTDKKTGKEYYLELDQKGNAAFVYLTDADKVKLADWKNNTTTGSTYRPGMKFCFPYKMVNNKLYPLNNRIEYINEGLGEDPNKPNTPETNPFYYYGKVFIQSYATFYTTGQQNVYPYVVRVNATSAILEGQNIGDLYSVDYRKDLNATNWFFGDNGVADQEWVRLHGVPNVSTGWMREAKNATGADMPVGSDYFVAKTLVPENGVEFAQRIYRESMNDVNYARLNFVFIDSAILGTYDPKIVWYYKIKNDNGEYLTSSGHKPGSANPYGTNYDKVDEGYAFFTKDSITDKNYRQSFGLKCVKPDSNTGVNPWNFWVVAGVDSTKNNVLTSDYYYLASVNGSYVFRYGGGTKRQDAEKTAMVFQYGQTTKDKYTDLDDVTTEGVEIYGIENAVVVNGAEGLINIYTIDGRLIKTVDAVNSTQTISAPKGVVIVKNGLNVAKVVVK